MADALCNFGDVTDGTTRRAVDQIGVATIGEAAALPDLDVPILILRPIENEVVSGVGQIVIDALDLS